MKDPESPTKWLKIQEEEKVQEEKVQEEKVQEEEKEQKTVSIKEDDDGKDGKSFHSEFLIF